MITIGNPHEDPKSPQWLKSEEFSSNISKQSLNTILIELTKTEDVYE
jgi:hypothetical protein